jgi:hypothetical protein
LPEKVGNYSIKVTENYKYDGVAKKIEKSYPINVRMPSIYVDYDFDTNPAFGQELDVIVRIINNDSKYMLFNIQPTFSSDLSLEAKETNYTELGRGYDIELVNQKYKIDRNGKNGSFWLNTTVLYETKYGQELIFESHEKIKINRSKILESSEANQDSSQRDLLEEQAKRRKNMFAVIVVVVAFLIVIILIFILIKK